MNHTISHMSKAEAARSAANMIRFSKNVQNPILAKTSRAIAHQMIEDFLRDRLAERAMMVDSYREHVSDGKIGLVLYKEEPEGESSIWGLAVSVAGARYLELRLDRMIDRFGPLEIDFCIPELVEMQLAESEPGTLPPPPIYQ